MGKLSLSLLSFLLLLGLSSALREGSWQQGECQLSSINAREPSYTVRSEGGQTEFWDHRNDEFRCAGVSIRRHRIQQRGLLLPVYHNTPILVYVIQGRGTYGIVNSGCPETFESSQQYSAEERSQRSREDRHQKVEECRQGDVIAVRAGEAHFSGDLHRHWVYNDGEEELVVVVFHDNSNYANQLDQNPRSFFLAGNPGSQQEEARYIHRSRSEGAGGEQSQGELGNVFRGFDDEVLAEAFGVDVETARKLRRQNDERGHIIRAERSIQLIQPRRSQEEYGRREEGYHHGRDDGLEETICSARNKENLDRASRADFYNPRAGRFSTLNAFNLPILRFLRLSAARGVLHRNAIFTPYWFANAHNLMYATRGAARVQIVNHNGQAVFDGQLREGQAVVVPQNFAVLKQAEEEGFEWVSFNTNDNAYINTLSGRTSAIRGLPVDVVANAYQIPREEAERLKFSRQETLIFGGSRRGRAASA